MVTKEHLAQLRAERHTPHARLEYTPDGPGFTNVVANLETEREREIAQGERAMQDALRDMRFEHALSRHQGQAKAFFNHTSDNTNH